MCNFKKPEAPKKVSPMHIAKLVDSLEYRFQRVGDTPVTGCWAFLPNGFKIGYGESSAIDWDEYNEELGMKYSLERAKADATNKLWEMEGYMLKMTGHTS